MTTLSTGKQLSIAIDGPAGAGKSTTARMLAAQLGFVYVDSGAMYRAVAWRCHQDDAITENPDTVASIAQNLDITFAPSENGDMAQKVYADGIDVTSAIRTQVISQLASSISAQPTVRDILVAKQRKLGQCGGVVMEGRDIGTVVLPDAEVKIFLTASLDERARRRFLEMEIKGDTTATLNQVRDAIAERDERDSTRAVSPLTPAEDSHIVDSEEMTARQVVDAILDICASKS